MEQSMMAWTRPHLLFFYFAIRRKGNFKLIATYVRDANCQTCMDMYPNQVGEECKHCLEIRTETVKILDFCKGLFGANAIIMFKNGTLQMGPINKLKIQEITL